MVEERLGVFERRRLGLTVGKLVPLVKDLQAQGALTGNVSADAAALAALLVEQEKDLYLKEAGRDWQAFFEALLAFLEKVLPLILQLIALFG